jgi:hypothetical protein
MQVQFARDGDGDRFVVFFGWHELIFPKENRRAIKNPPLAGRVFHTLSND